METLERDNAALQKSVEEQQLKKETAGGRRGTFSSPATSPFVSKRAAFIEQTGTPAPDGGAPAAMPTGDSLLLLAKVRWKKYFKNPHSFQCPPSCFRLSP